MPKPNYLTILSFPQKNIHLKQLYIETKQSLLINQIRQVMKSASIHTAFGQLLEDLSLYVFSFSFGLRTKKNNTNNSQLYTAVNHGSCKFRYEIHFVSNCETLSTTSIKIHFHVVLGKVLFS